MCVLYIPIFTSENLSESHRCTSTRIFISAFSPFAHTYTKTTFEWIIAYLYYICYVANKKNEADRNVLIIIWKSIWNTLCEKASFQLVLYSINIYNTNLIK